MRKKPKLSGPLNLAPESRVSHFWFRAQVLRSYMRLPPPQLFFESISKSTEYPLLLTLSTLQHGWPLLLLRPFTIYFTPCHRTCASTASFRSLRLISGIVITPTHSLSSHYRQLSSSSSHYTLHRISGIVQRSSRNRPPLMDSSAVLPQPSTHFPHPICSRFFLGLSSSCALTPVQLPHDVFGIVVSCTHAPLPSVPIVFPHLSFR